MGDRLKKDDQNSGSFNKYGTVHRRISSYSDLCASFGLVFVNSHATAGVVYLGPALFHSGAPQVRSTQENWSGISRF